MVEQNPWIERRNFGRRPLNAPASAQLPGPVEVPCIIENISEGGALLHFPTGVAPIDRFDLHVEDAGIYVPCEMRHQVGVRFGVRFRREDLGEALVKHFFPGTLTAVPEQLAVRKPETRMEPASVRGLRDAVLPIFALDQPGRDGAGATAPIRASTIAANTEPATTAPAADESRDLQFSAAPSGTASSPRPARMVSRRPPSDRSKAIK